MADFTREDLAFNGYSQTIDTEYHPKTIEVLDRIYVDKTEEFEVIHFCNQFLKKYKVPQTKASFQKAETFLQHPYLENEIYRAQLLEWIASNWIKI
jgi:trehalose/maltose hydrolase-like predicted phosphorylase